MEGFRRFEEIAEQLVARGYARWGRCDQCSAVIVKRPNPASGWECVFSSPRRWAAAHARSKGKAIRMVQPVVLGCVELFDIAVQKDADSDLPAQ